MLPFKISPDTWQQEGEGRDTEACFVFASRTGGKGADMTYPTLYCRFLVSWGPSELA